METQKSDSNESVDKVEEYVETTIIEYHRHKQKKTEPNEPIEQIETKVEAKVECNSCSCCK